MPESSLSTHTHPYFFVFYVCALSLFPHPGSNVVASLGIGRGSCQWMVLQTNGEAELVAHKAGMSDLPNLALLSSTVQNTKKREEGKGRGQGKRQGKEKGEANVGRKPCFVVDERLL